MHTCLSHVHDVTHRIVSTDINSQLIVQIAKKSLRNHQLECMRDANSWELAMQLFLRRFAILSRRHVRSATTVIVSTVSVQCGPTRAQLLRKERLPSLSLCIYPLSESECYICLLRINIKFLCWYKADIVLHRPIVNRHQHKSGCFLCGLSRSNIFSTLCSVFIFWLRRFDCDNECS
jgi:hypothetical protein